ncbi:MAG TPA: cupin domain-containing protein [Candidatus Dormibacteraeota bacterium]|nr:cupin domain-containing protein [Candidatus Dormibacteraeota bacterium]
MSAAHLPASEVLTPGDADALAARVGEAVAASGWRPDRIVAVRDPASPGGPEVAAALLERLRPRGRAIALLGVEGRAGLRRVQEVPALARDVRDVLLVDDAAWSGSTLAMARTALRRATEAEIRTAVLLAGGPALLGRTVDYCGGRAAAREVVFPWGVSGPSAERCEPLGASAGAGRVVGWGPRPWGGWEQLALNEPCTVRVLTILPGQCLSLQYHGCRDELFVVLDDGLDVHVGGERLAVRRGDYVLVTRGTVHRLGASPAGPARVLEVSFGHYDQVRDIVRLADAYGRTGLDGSI